MKKLTAYTLGIVFATIPFFVSGMSPKPKKKFNLFYNTSALKNPKKIYLIECRDASCLTYDTLFENESVSASVTGNLFTISAPAFSEKAKLLFVFDDRAISSGIFAAKAFNPEYDVTITDTEINVEETSSFWHRKGILYNLLRTFFVACAVEIVIALVAFRRYNIALTKIKFIPLFNLVTLSIFWFVICNIFSNLFLTAFLGIAITISLELFLFMKAEKTLSIRNAARLSLVLNLTSSLIIAALQTYWYYG